MSPYALNKYGRTAGLYSCNLTLVGIKFHNLLLAGWLSYICNFGSENFTSNPNEFYCHEFINIESSFLLSFTSKEILEENENDYYLNLGTLINPPGRRGVGRGEVTPMRTGAEMFVSDRSFYWCSALKTSNTPNLQHV